MREMKLTRHDVGRERFVAEVSLIIYTYFLHLSNFTVFGFNIL